MTSLPANKTLEPGEVTMPDVEGLSQSAATNQLEGQGLTVKVVKEYDPDIAAGKCTRTVPGVGEKAQKGSEIQLYVSRGPKQVLVPDVVGQDLDAATKTLDDAGFDVTSTEEDSSKPQNEVLSQSPSAGGKADDGSKIKLKIASGQNTVPDVTGLQESDAKAQLQDAGFKVKAKTVDVTDQTEDGLVQTQDPTGGTADVGSTVTLEIGKFVDNGTP